MVLNVLAASSTLLVSGARFDVSNTNCVDFELLYCSLHTVDMSRFLIVSFSLVSDVSLKFALTDAISWIWCMSACLCM